MATAHSALNSPQAATAAPLQTIVLPGTWTAKSPMPGERNEVIAVGAAGKVFVLGGSLRQTDYALTRNEEYDLATGAWRARAPLPSGASHLAAAALHGSIYVIGGFTGRDHKGPVDRVFAYDIAADAWRTLPPLAVPRGSIGAAALGGKIHAVAGRVTNDTDDWHTNGVVGTHEVYDPATGRWTEAAPLPTPRDHLAVVAAGGKLHAIGGRYGNNDQMSELHDVYDPATQAWTPAPPLPTARGAVAGALYNGLILVIGGEDETRTYVENEGYDVELGRWLKLAPMPAGRHGHGAAVIGGSAYVAGGALQRGGRGATDELLAFSLPR
jgi:N-acetylneuraminic acid mutarotase